MNSSDITKSNVTLKSNICINKNATTKNRFFLEHITDYRILDQYRKWDTHNVTDWMTPLQQEILRQGQPNCAKEDGTMSWGVPLNGRRMVCRCEQYDCPLFDKLCSKYPNFERIVRESSEDAAPHSDNKDITALPLYSETCAVVSLDESTAASAPSCPADDSALSSVSPLEPSPEKTEQQESAGNQEHAKHVEVIELPETPAPQAEEDANDICPAQNEDEACISSAHTVSVSLADQQTIIHAGISDRIWVNAGPGTGKTYVVIQRLKELLAEEMDGTILVLCFSRNAVQVIRDILHEAMAQRADAMIESGQLLIRTFDSFATYMLEDELDIRWSYDERIEAFIKMLRRNGGTLNDMIDYLIVDEIQDTVGVRARMLLSLLDELHCGALLLGDQCQAIFDWTVRESNDLSFSELAAQLSQRNFKRYELEGNHRQSQELASKGLALRTVMLSADQSAQEDAVCQFKAWVKKQWPCCSVSNLAQCLTGSSDLVLCKTNGEAAHVSQVLFETDIPHYMKQSSGHRTLSSWIAKALCGNDGLIFLKEQFFSNATKYKLEDAETKWAVLKALDGHSHAPGLHMPELLSALARMDGLPTVCLNQANDNIVVSTVHRAKGSEAEHVYWLDSPLVFDNQQDQDGAMDDALKAAYVAATRAKTDIRMIEPDAKVYMKSINDSRWIQCGYSKSKKPYCKRIALFPDDVDPASFADTDAESRQSILSCIKPGDLVDLYPNEITKRFDIFFDGNLIGFTSAGFTDALFCGFAATNGNRNWPASIPNVFVTALTTVIAPDSSDVDEKYRTAGCWLGIELGGLPIIDWS